MMIKREILTKTIKILLRKQRFNNNKLKEYIVLK